MSGHDRIPVRNITKFIIAALLIAGIGVAPQPASAAAAVLSGPTSQSVRFQTGSVGTASTGMLSALSLPPPVPFFAPPAQRVRTLVGVDTWFWVTPASWRPVVRVIPVGKVLVTLVATPVTLQLVPGDGSPPVSCPGPGTPWAWPGTRSPCSHTFQRSSTARLLGRFSGTVQTVWTIRWTSSTGLSGTAGPVVVPTPVSLRVVEAQAVLER